jgi:drug/metabolite transporter (DMT)-like permease
MREAQVNQGGLRSQGGCAPDFVALGREARFAARQPDLPLPSPDPNATPAPRQSPMLGIGLKLISVAVFLSMASFIKAAGDVPPGQLVFFRSFFAILPIIVFLAWRRELIAGFKTDKPMAHFWRGVVGVGGMSFGFYALTKLPLPEAVAIGYAMPIIIVIFGAVFLKEEVRLYRWSAVAVGIIGVAIIVWPRLTVFSGNAGEVSDLTLGAVSSLIAAVFAGFATMHVRHLVQTERSATIVLYFSITCSVVGLLTLPLGLAWPTAPQLAWVWPNAQQWAVLIGAGIAGGIGQILLTEAYRHADVSVVAPFEYTSLILSIIVGYVFFSDVPTIEMLIGGVIVVAAGLFIIWREHALGLERRKQREVTPPSPG